MLKYEFIAQSIGTYTILTVRTPTEYYNIKAHAPVLNLPQIKIYEASSASSVGFLLEIQYQRGVHVVLETAIPSSDRLVWWYVRRLMLQE